ncbi:Ig-like domain repeat protein [Paenibacillus sp. WQ 127069]|uniref:Ig-like domain repeat protein n=1 Tax=Paenibacillus baimaensis TaxID=2982185 RepID=A0ABT2UEV4_9BACL|nr:Ig-like domain repeat protein [Paenibacillus sp. WQ 127069]MCU6793178.1 Ig-like domain repeat protein [Paenibacillus sp. WQ 127069]
MDRFFNFIERIRFIGFVLFFVLITSMHPDAIFAQNVTTSTISSSVAASTYGNSVTFTTYVTDSAIQGTQPSGTVTFKDGSLTMGTATLSSTVPAVATVPNQPAVPSGMKVSCYSGPDTFTSVDCPVVKWGDYTYWAFSYNDNRDSLGIVAYDSSGTVVKQWERTGTRYLWQITVDASAQSITFWGQGTSNATVEWGFLENHSAAASFTTSTLAIGTHTITAAYSGEGNHTGSTSGGVQHTVNPIATSTTLNSNANPSSYGNSVDFIATVTSLGGYPATGTVTFTEGSTTLGTASLAGGAATFSTSSLSAGTHAPITAVYEGDSLHSGSMSTGLTQVVNKLMSSTSLTFSSNTSAYGDSVTINAQVTSSPGGEPTGMVTFKDGITILGIASLSGGQASISISSLTAGNHSIKAEYTGDTNFMGSASSATSLEILLRSNSNLSGLTLDGISMVEPFNKNVYVYTASVSNTVHAVAVRASLEDSTASIKVNGIALSVGQASSPIDLQVGSNNISIEVTAQDGTSKSTYAITIQRSAAERMDAAQALTKISSMYDSNMDGKFDADDVREILLLIEPVSIVPLP